MRQIALQLERLATGCRRVSRAQNASMRPLRVGARPVADVPLILDRYRAGDPPAALVRAFVLGESVVARVRLTPFAGLLVAHDAGPSHAGFVTGVNAGRP
jgi:hypothetical protein